MKILVIDNYDSFTYNLVHIIRELGHAMDIFRNDKIGLEEVKRYDKILLSPGPGIPDEAGIMKEVIKEYSPSKVFLGFAWGIRGLPKCLERNFFNIPKVLHGVTSQTQVIDASEYLFSNIPHSLSGNALSLLRAVVKESLTESLKITAVNGEGLVMGLSHVKYDVKGLQFHPESIMTPEGPAMIKNWINKKMKTVLNELIDHRSLSKETAHKVLVDLASGKYNLSQTAAFMTVYMMRSITVGELQGFRDAMLELCIPVKFEEPVMDVCGTGGDGKNTFNISTLSSFVVAAAGQPVAKHGNYGVSSACDSSNVLEYFGYSFTNDTDELKRTMERANICFMHAPLFHPAMKNVAPIRKELGVKTFFNMLGPMVNPAFPTRQLVGVFSLELARQYGYLYQNTEKNFVILHSLGGYDEISLTGQLKYFDNGGEHLIEPSDIGFPKLSESEIKGGSTIEESAKIFMQILEGNGTPAQNAVVIANAGMALFAGHQKEGLPTAMGKAKEALMSGKALDSFKHLLTK